MCVVLITHTLLEIARLKYRRSIHDSTIKSFVVILHIISERIKPYACHYKNDPNHYYYFEHNYLSVITNYKLLFVKGIQVFLLGMNPLESLWYLYLHLYLYLYDRKGINLSQESRIKKPRARLVAQGCCLLFKLAD